MPIAYCLLPIAYCLLPTAYCLLPIVYCLLPIAYCLLPIAYCLLPIAYPLGATVGIEYIQERVLSFLPTSHIASILVRLPKLHCSTAKK